MRIRPFGVEQWMNEWETRCDWNLAETCVESLTVAELLEMAGLAESILEELLPMQLTYGHVEGRAGCATTWPRCTRTSRGRTS